MSSNQTSLEFKKPLVDDISLNLAFKVLPTKGNMAWEYNPFRNYRLSEAKFYFRLKYFSKEELLTEFGIEDINSFISSYGKKTVDELFESLNNWDIFRDKTDFIINPITTNEEDPILYDKNQLVDFETDELKFDLNHPVDIQTQYSYDGSVNLILNDGLNKPRMINSRFSSLGRNKYLIVDRKGDNDTNIYDLGEQFDTDTSLYKTYSKIPKIDFIGVYNGGNLKIGNYCFYFRYVDADGNETDFVGESGIVSIFKGNNIDSVTSGFRNESAYKTVKFLVDNIDTSYKKLSVYYTRSTSDIQENAVTEAVKINLDFLVNNSGLCVVQITGNESTTTITTDELNPLYQIAENAFTQSVCLNMLFLGNTLKEDIPYTKLLDLSLRFLPSPDTTLLYEPIDATYNRSNVDTYYDPQFIYNYTGYQKNELYRFGIVYILNSGTLTPVFNIRGMYFNENTTNENYTTIPLDKTIAYDEDTGILCTDGVETTQNNYENAFGVTRTYFKGSEFTNICGIKIEVQEGVIDKLKELKIKGYFFVRLKRMPLRLCLAYVMGVDPESHTPLLYIDKSVDLTVESYENVKENNYYLTERFLNDDRLFSHDVTSRYYCIKPSSVNTFCAICPEYDIRSEYYNSLFTGEEYYFKPVIENVPLKLVTGEDRLFSPEIETYEESSDTTYYLTKVIGVEDNVKLVECSNKMYSARAGEAEEAFRFEYLENEKITTECNNLVRGSYGPFLGINGYNQPGSLVNIYIKDIIKMSVLDMFKLRYEDKSSYYAISERYEIDSKFENPILYRGDSFICTFTHRFNRNFLDPSAPTNDKIVDSDGWKENFEVSDGVVKTENFENINLGDVNAIKLGLWVTLPVISSYNLNIRAVDESNTDEMSLTGKARGFYPYQSMSPSGNNKIAEALCINNGFTKMLSERYNFEVPDVPAIKNDFTNRISYSDINVNDAFKNGFRTFLGTHYRDYPKTYGLITKLVELRGSLLCVFEHGIALIPVNERAVAGEGSGGNIYINTSNVLPENPKIISDTFGSQWRESIIKTPVGVYGVDTIGKKIWRTNGENFECISDFKVLEFLNKNITLTEREIDPIIGIRNVKTHYNKFKHDVMFTFYDNLHGFEEKVWNLCYSEILQKWITFYSWVPSYSENIYNQYFSFNRDTSKWISKLGVSHHGNDFSDGVTLSENIFANTLTTGGIIGELYLDNRTLPEGDGIKYSIYFSLGHDNYKNYKKFKIIDEIDSEGNLHLYLALSSYSETVPKKDENGEIIINPDTKSVETEKIEWSGNATDYCSEFYVRGIKEDDNTYTEKITDLSNETLKKDWIDNCVLSNKYIICKDDTGRRKTLKSDPELRINPSTIVYLLNIKATITISYKGKDSSLIETYTNGFNNTTKVDAGYYESVVAVMPQYNMLFLTTDFWKHGQAGIIDIADNIYPTYWYGKQHPFEFEFVVADTPQAHKIFDDLQIISNNAEPESFHYEIVGDCYDFAKDKKNMYIRLEATKELYLYNGSDILFNSDYVNLDSEHRKNYRIQNGKKIELDSYDKSTLLPLYYLRLDTINEIEDTYRSMTAKNKDYSNLSGGEIVRYDTLDEYHIWNHAKAVDITDPEKGRLRGNMQYKEDKWYVQINPLNIVLKNESEWGNLDDKPTNKIPVELKLNPLPSDVLTTDIDVPSSFDEDQGRGYVLWNWLESLMRESKIKDKWVKIRVRYKGNKLAIISAIVTLYSISYS